MDNARELRLQRLQEELEQALARRRVTGDALTRAQANIAAYINILRDSAEPLTESSIYRGLVELSYRPVVIHECPVCKRLTGFDPCGWCINV